MTPEEKPKRAADIAKERLKKYIPLAVEIEDLQRRIKELEETMYSPQIPGGDGMPRASGVSDPTARIVNQKMALLERYTDQEASLEAFKLELEDDMRILSPTERTLIRHKYIDGMTWEEVCVAMRYSWTHTHRIHSAALVKLGEAEAKAQG